MRAANCPWKKSSLTFFHLKNLRFFECYALSTASCSRAGYVSTACSLPVEKVIPDLFPLLD